ncbi:MAG: M15 family peptidase [Acidimicrobiia bacterium]|nr:M15 family peptidase [Acidimicrobiia bacterium]
MIMTRLDHIMGTVGSSTCGVTIGQRVWSSGPKHIAVSILVLLVAVSCGTDSEQTDTEVESAPSTTALDTPASTPGSTTSTAVSTSAATTTVVPTSTTPETTPQTSAETTLPEGVTLPPDWLGTRVLPTDENGLGEVQPTPPELQDRRFTTEDVLPPPPDDSFHSTIDEVHDDVLERSTWVEDCPITAEDLAYMTVTFVGFDARHHTGELLVDMAVAEDLVFVFEMLFEAEFPIEEMRITSPEDLDAPPTGDGNVTSAFACRPVVGQDSGWSQHALGTAIDINPFHNPYVKDEVVLPELATAYVDRDRGLPGMIEDGDVVAEAFAEIGWTWGGTWNSLKDYQHFSLSGG